MMLVAFDLNQIAPALLCWFRAVDPQGAYTNKAKVQKWKTNVPTSHTASNRTRNCHANTILQFRHEIQGPLQLSNYLLEICPTSNRIRINLLSIQIGNHTGPSELHVRIVGSTCLLLMCLGVLHRHLTMALCPTMAQSIKFDRVSQPSMPRDIRTRCGQTNLGLHSCHCSACKCRDCFKE